MELIILLLCAAVLIQYVGIPAPTLRIVQIVLAVLIILFLLRVFMFVPAGEPIFWFRR